MKKALKANLFFIWFFVVALTAIAFINGVEGGISALKATVSAGILATIIYAIPFNEKIKGTMLVSMPAIFAMILSISSGGNPRMFSLYIVALVMQALYFDRKLMIGFGGALILVLVAVYLINPALLLGQGAGIIEFMSPMSALVCAFTVLVLLTKWGQENLAEVKEEGIRSREALAKIEAIFEEISTSSSVLKNKATYCNDKM